MERKSKCPICHHLFNHLGIARHIASHRDKAKVERKERDKALFPTMTIKLGIKVDDTTSFLYDTEITDWVCKAVQRKRKAMGLPDTKNIETTIQLIPKQ